MSRPYHRARTVSVLLLLLLIGACQRTEKPTTPAPVPRLAERWVGGIQVNEPDHLVWGTTLLASGLDTVEVTVYAKQGDWDSSNLWFEDEEPAVLSEVRMAKTLGLKVVLILRVALDHAFPRNRFLWHGMILPTTDEDLAEWFDRYGRFVEKWTAIAARERIDVVGIGSEMSALTNTVPLTKIPDLHAYYLSDAKQAEYRAIVLADPERITSRHLAAAGGGDFVETEVFLKTRAKAWAEWAKETAYAKSSDPVTSMNQRRSALEAGWRNVIRRARKNYRGPLTYAANFDQYRDVAFWDALDLIGINAYFGLRDTIDKKAPAALRAELRTGWTNVLREIDTFRATKGLHTRRVLFTELGYTRRRGATAAPWASGGFEVLHLSGKNQLVVWTDQPHDDAERAAAVDALADAVESRNDDLFAGVLYWKLSSIAAHRAIEPFVLTLDPTEQDPMLPALVRFNPSPSEDRLAP